MRAWGVHGMSEQLQVAAIADVLAILKFAIEL